LKEDGAAASLAPPNPPIIPLACNAGIVAMGNCSGVGAFIAKANKSGSRIAVAGIADIAGIAGIDGIVGIAGIDGIAGMDGSPGIGG